MIGNKNKEKEKKIVRDDFYDKQNYREIRNIFSEIYPGVPEVFIEFDHESQKAILLVLMCPIAELDTRTVKE